MTKILFILLMNIFSFSAFADVKCTLGSAVRCPCPASMQVICPDGVRGWIANQAPVKSVTLSYKDAQGQDATIVLENPQATARDFYAPSYNEWVMAQLPQGSTNVRSLDLSFDSNTPLYGSNGSMGQPLPAPQITVSGNPPTTDFSTGLLEPSCLYLSDSLEIKNYISVKGEQCSRAPIKVCQAEVRCNREFVVNKTSYPADLYTAYCKVDQATQRCPSDPIDCFSDSSIDTLESEGNRFIELNGSGAARAISQ